MTKLLEWRRSSTHFGTASKRRNRNESQDWLFSQGTARTDTCFGQICGQEGVATLREVFDDIAGQAEKVYKAGVPAEEAQHRYALPEKFKNFPIYAWGFTIGPAITKLYAEWKAGKS